MKRNAQVNFAGSYKGKGEEGFAGILIVEEEMFQAVLRRTRALVIARNRNKVQSTVTDMSIHLFH
jgi:hypothetical protein